VRCVGRRDRRRGKGSRAVSRDRRSPSSVQRSGRRAARIGDAVGGAQLNAQRRHTVIFGLGITGYSCVRFLNTTDQLTVIDTRSAPPFAEQTRAQYPDVELVLGTADAARFGTADRIVVSPGLTTSHCLLKSARDRG